MQQPFIITVASEKGGVGKTTLACNLAVFIKAIAEDLPVTVLSLDNHRTVDKMFTLGNSSGSVDKLLSGIAEAPAMGQYGVQYFSSSDNLDHHLENYRRPTAVLEAITKSRLDGIIIIDTRPVLDSLTTAAIIAADRVLVPVRDSASLENCRNIFALFEKKGMDRSTLLLLPSIIDNRIKFDGTFSNLDQLVRGFAINRGYRIAPVTIPKSPKVEALSTNPSGAVLSILHYAKGTDAHTAYRELARTITQEATANSASRTTLYVQWSREESLRLEARMTIRRQQLLQSCACCGQKLAKPAWLAVASDEPVAAFHDDCIESLLLPAVYDAGLHADNNSGSPAHRISTEACRRALHHITPCMVDGRVASIAITSVDAGGAFSSSLDLTGLQAADSGRYPLQALLSLTVSGYGGRRTDRPIVLVRLATSIEPAITDTGWGAMLTSCKGIDGIDNDMLKKAGI